MSTTKTTVQTYNQNAKIYHEHVNSKLNFRNKFIEGPAITALLQDIVFGKDVLDLGCGSGLSTWRIHELGANVKGIDISEGLIKIAKEIHPSIEFKVGDTQNLPYEANSFDVVSSSLVLHYIQDLKIPFKEVARVLKPNGWFVFSMDHPFSQRINKIEIDGKEYKLAKPYFHNNKLTWTMLGGTMTIESYHHTIQDISDSLINSGFEIKRIVEPLPLQESKASFAEDYDKTTTYPTFIVFKCKLAK